MKPTKEQKKEYVNAVLKEVERVVNLAIDAGEDEKTQHPVHPLELIDTVFRAYVVKSLEMAMKKEGIEYKQNEAPATDLNGGKVIDFGEAKAKKTWH